ncbi:MAG: hypothetical protein QOG79_334 [Mycobacterium sp.]|jgi:hypothetical protein|nr:hypothetical protein [Mycobacterium sp.]MDT5297092.1 hypothetical protein [Mycobacterium sp.]
MGDWNTWAQIAAVLVAGGGIIGFLYSRKNAIREDQLWLRKELRVVLRRILETCEAYGFGEESPSIPNDFKAAMAELKHLREEGIISPNAKHLTQLERLLDDFAASWEAIGLAPRFAVALSREHVDAVVENKRANVKKRHAQIERRATVYLNATTKMDQDRYRTYLRYRIIEPKPISGI